jgi:hypothetical protein
VAIILSLREPEVTKMYREYWKLKWLHNLYSLYEEIGDEGIRDVLKVCRLTKKEGKSSEYVVKLLDLVDENNPYGLSFLEKRHKWLKDEVRELDMNIQRSRNYLYNLSNQIAHAEYTLYRCRDTEQHLRQDLQRLYEEKSKIESLVNENDGNIAD